VDPRFYRSVALRGTVGAGEAYMEGWWNCSDLVSLVQVLAADSEAVQNLDRGLSRLARPALKLFHGLRPNSRAGSRRNIGAHYDLGNGFFELLLDPSMTYSCGLFEHGAATMEEASTAKLESACRALDLSPGWGSFAIHAGRTRGCHVRSVTLSREQCELARRRVHEAGLAELVEVDLRDYRDVTGSYDKLVSIEMIEAVGRRNLDAFFRICSERLRSAGAMFLQAIIVSDADFAHSRSNVDFIKRHIFPGGQLVSVAAVRDSLERTTDLRLSQLRDITPHYAKTLACWRGRMAENLDRMRGLGLPDRFLRMWEFYLSYCEGAFLERANGVVQMLLTKPLHVPSCGALR
jgi:cyclopropane-fatty-acyl-phospholipid synthase